MIRPRRPAPARSSRAVKLLARLCLALCALASVGLLSGGCADRLASRLEPLSRVRRPDPKRHPGADAVILSRTDELFVELEIGSGEPPRLRRSRHDLIGILDESGFKYAEVKLPLSDDHTLVSFEARTIDPDGEVHPVSPSDIHRGEDRSPDNDEVQRYRIFRFPAVRVGSVLEYSFVTEEKEAGLHAAQRISGELPIDSYRAVLHIPPSISPEVQVYGVNSRFRKEDDYTYALYSFSARDVPPALQESLGLPASRREPYWIYRAGALQADGYRTLSIGETWGEALVPFIRILYKDNEKFFKGLNFVFEPKGCKTAECLLERAFEQLRQRTELSDFSDGLLDSRPLRQVLASHGANSTEQVLLLHHLLKQTRISAWFALTNMFQDDVADRFFPSPFQFDHLVLYVPKQEGIPAPLWLDPSCEECHLGQIPGWLRGQGCVIWNQGPWSDRAVLQNARAAFYPITGEPPSPASTERHHRVRLRADGEIEVEVKDVVTGSNSVFAGVRARGWTAAAHRELAERFVSRRGGAGHLVDHSRLKCDRDHASCVRTLRYVLPGYATADGDRLLVPLRLLEMEWDDLLHEESRRGALFLREDDRNVEQVVFELPPGYHAVDLPAPESATSAAVDFTLTAESAPGTVTVRRVLVEKRGLHKQIPYAPVREAARRFAGVTRRLLVLEKDAAVKSATAKPSTPAPGFLAD